MFLKEVLNAAKKIKSYLIFFMPACIMSSEREGEKPRRCKDMLVKCNVINC